MSTIQEKSNFANDDTNKPNFVIIKQPEVPTFLTGKKREKYFQLREIERIQNIDKTKDEDFKVTMFSFWKKERARMGNPLTQDEEKYYSSLKNHYEWTNLLVVTLPAAIFIYLQKNDIAFTDALVISLGIGMFIKIILIVFNKIYEYYKVHQGFRSTNR